MIYQFDFQGGRELVKHTRLKVLDALVSGIFIMGMLWTSLPMVGEDRVVFCVCWISDATTLYWRIIVLEMVVVEELWVVVQLGAM